jgi:hypothetical protein
VEISDGTVHPVGMDTPPVESSLAFTLSWNSGGRLRQASVSFAAALRVALVLSLCVGCYEAGRWRARLEAQNEVKPDSRVIVVERNDKAIRTENAGMAAGSAFGDNKDVITPLNVRDPSALVMGPGATEGFADTRSVPPPAPAAPHGSVDTEKQIPDVAPPPKVYKKPKDIKPNQRF